MRTVAALVVTLVAALALVGCTADPTPTERERQQGADRPEDAATEGEALTAAAQTAEAATSATLVGLALEADGTWDADLLTDQGVELRVVVSADGSRVVERRRDDTDADDRAENRPLLGATLDWSEAVDAVAGELPGSVGELGLDEDDGRLLWEVGTGEEAAGSTYLVDARSGEVLGPERD